MLSWGVATEADFFLTLQDDVELAPNFWGALTAMLEAWYGGDAGDNLERPPELLCLASNHSLAPEVARQGRRSYYCPSVLGWGWGCSAGVLGRLLRDLESGPKSIDAYRSQTPGGSEDVMIAKWAAGSGALVRHPVPTIVDQRYVPSTFEGNDRHTHRKATVTWRDYGDRAASMTYPEFWRSYAPSLPIDIERACCYCGDREAFSFSPKTGAGLCRDCLPRHKCAWCGEGEAVARTETTGLAVCQACFMMPGRVFSKAILSPGDNK
jgi:hypothetical protein